MSHAALSPKRALFLAGRILLVWAFALALENLVVGFGYRAMFAGYWEMALARQFLSPLLLTVLVPFALLAGLYAEKLRSVAEDDAGRAAKAHAALAFVFGAAVAIAVSTGRHMQSALVRGPFVLVVAGAFAALVHRGAPRLLARSAGARAGLGVALGAVFWLADSFVLPRLYPGFHAACLVLLLVSLALAAPALPKVCDRLGVGAIVLAIVLAPLVKVEARGAARSDNLRMVLLDRAPLLGRAVRIAAWVVPVEEGDEPTADTARPSAEVPRALDWTGADLVLLTVDALRADHVSAYGYPRPTTPAIDALAARGTRFSHAYCPTPHTSYSVTSLLTGKYMKPLLSLGVGEGSETMATHLRRYGYRTAAFYPPAVFFIDEARFTHFRDTGLDFEYRKVEFADRALRVAQVTKYVQNAPKDKPLFLWVHLFEPHEPYVVHDAHVFGGANARRTDVDAYDSEVAEADQTVGEIVRAVEASRPRATFVVSADHGEEFGEHGGRYHGTTVYEEQVRVPLVVVGAGVRVQTLEAPVETIDVLPTALSALGIPRPARVRGRDLGPVLKDGELTPAQKAGFAFAETDDFTLVAEGAERLVCARKIAACSLYDLAHDPAQSHDIAPGSPRAKALRKRLAETERDHGRYEGGQKLPDALRRGKQGEADAAEDVAALFEDASVEVRREAAEVAFLLNRPAATANGARRAFGREEDLTTKRFLALTLVRGKEPDPAARSVVEGLMSEADLAWRRRGALALADAGDPKGAAVLAAWLEVQGPEALELDRAREIMALLGRHRAKVGVPALVSKLADLRQRPYAADALGAIGDPSARDPLLTAFGVERYRPTRVKLASALLAVGTKEEMFPLLARFGGVPEPLENVVTVARLAGLLVPKRGGIAASGDGGAAGRLAGALMVPAGAFRVLVEAAGPGLPVVTVSGVAVAARGTSAPTLTAAEVAGEPKGGPREIVVTHPAGLLGVLVVPLAEELPPPPKEAWDAGISETDEARANEGPRDAGLSVDAKAE